MASTVSRPPRTPGRFLPPDPRVEEPYRLTPQLALRIAILGTVVLGAFAVLFLRLWALQVLSGDEYLHAAQNNQLRTVRLPAPRGAILDRNGRVLVRNAAGSSVQLWPADLPKTWPEQRDMLRRLSAVVDVPVRQMLRELERRKGDPLTPVVVKRAIHEEQIAFLYERSSDFPGVTVAQSYLRTYPNRALAAHLLGHVGEATEDQLERNRRLRLGDEVGQGGVEAAFDAYLRGTAGAAQLRVDSLGRPRSALEPTRQPRPGHDVRLTIDAELQRAAEGAIRYGIQRALLGKEWYANGGAVVALDPRNGEVLALASWPSFKPSVYVGRVRRQALAEQGLLQRTAEQKNTPGLNRAIAGVYPPGSTWKPITALAAMQEGQVTPYTPIQCSPTYTYIGENGVAYDYDNWTPAYNVSMTLDRALETSCDTYFYELGVRFYNLPGEQGPLLQGWASRFGFGERTGIEVGPEETGLLPTPSWKKRRFSEDPVERFWKPGDSINLSIGQGDLTVTPLQMARFYALLANGGRLVTPHLGLQVEQPGSDGTGAAVLQRFAPRPPVPTGVDPAAVRAVHRGLVLAAHGSEGTSTGVFGSFPVAVAGKTGTSEKYSSKHGRMLDQAWWCGYGPTDTPTYNGKGPLVVCAVIENGGHGGAVAAPAARKVFEAWFGVEGGPIAEVPSD